MKRGWLASSVGLVLIGCTNEDQDFARKKAKQAEEQLKQDAQKASEQLKRGAEAVNQRAGPKLDKAGRELKQDAQRASEKLKETTSRMRRDRHQDGPTPKEPPKEQ
jgi:hypothetical protein